MPLASRLPPRHLLMGVIAFVVVVIGAAVVHAESPGLPDPPHLDTKPAVYILL